MTGNPPGPFACYITGCGASLPRRVVTNAELAPALGLAPEWVERNSGIRERRWVDAGESTSGLAVAAVKGALNDAGLCAESLDYLIGCTLSPDYQVPGIAPLVQRGVEGCRAIPAIDLRAGCAGILYALQLARGLIASRAAERLVCFGAEAQSKGLDLSPASAELSMLFGDGAGAFVIDRERRLMSEGGRAREARPYYLAVEDVLIETDGSFAEELMVRAPGTANGARWLDESHAASKLQYGRMQGRTVILQAVRKLADASARVLERNDVTLDQVGVLIPHQANRNLLAALAKRLAVPEERIIMNVDRFGNTSGASAFIALWQAVKEERLVPGSFALILAFGAGFTWGAALCRVQKAD